MPLTALATYAPGDTITSAWANLIGSNFSLLDGRTGGDPGAAGKIPVSGGALAATWTTPADSTVLSDPKLSIANGGTLGGNLTAPNLAATNTLTTGGTATIGNAMNAAGAATAASVAASGALTGGSSSVTGTAAAANVTASNAMTAGGSISAGNAVAAVGAVSGASVAATGTVSGATVAASGAMTLGGSGVWTAANDGSGSGLDADVMHGITWKDPEVAVGSGTLTLTTSFQTAVSITTTADGHYIIEAEMMVTHIIGDGDNSTIFEGQITVDGVLNGNVRQLRAVTAGPDIQNLDFHRFPTAQIASGKVIALQARKQGGTGGSTVDKSFASIRIARISP